MIIGLQITAIIFALLMIYFALLHYKRGEISSLETASWLVIWIITILITVFPDILRTYAEAFAVSRLFDLMVVGGFIVVLSMVTASYVRTKKLEKKVEEFIRREAKARVVIKKK